MPRNLKGQSMLTLLDFSKDDIEYMLQLSKKFKDLKMAGVPHKYLSGKNIVLLFEKTSTRTRCSFEVAGMDLGMGVTYLDPGSSQMGKKESIEDTAKVLGRFYDGIEYRGYSQSLIQKLAENAGVPVWNGLTDDYHPTQMLADMLTIEENFGTLKNKKITFFGDARNNVANSLMIVCAKLGLSFTACGPNELMPKESLIKTCQSICETSGGSLQFTEDPAEGAKDADVLYTDIWVSMGEPEQIWGERIKLLNKYQINKELLHLANKQAIFLHCLPSFHDLETTVGKEINEKFGLKEMEVTNEVFLSPQSKVFNQAENRMHTIKAIMYATLH